VVFSLLFLSSCKKEELIPSYIYIDKIDVNTTYEIDGSNSHKITDAWIYVDDDLVGAFELPARVPVLKSGTHTIKVKAGIKVNGIANSRSYYPFYEAYTTTAELIPEKIDTLHPTVTYVEGKIKWKEDFEEGGISLEKFLNSDTTFIKTTNPADAFEGNYAAMVKLTSDFDKVITVSKDKFTIPQTNSAVFLEMNYKTDVELFIGLYGKIPGGTTQQFLTIVLNPNNQWNKIYINLTYSANFTYNTTDFQVFFAAEKPEAQTTGTIYLDNIKLLHN
jgi:hypothetical protein